MYGTLSVITNESCLIMMTIELDLFIIILSWKHCKIDRVKNKCKFTFNIVWRNFLLLLCIYMTTYYAQVDSSTMIH